MEIGNADYSKAETPAGYVCGWCGATGVKLWRNYNEFSLHLLCAACACKEQREKDDVDGQGFISSAFGRTVTICGRVPAVPCEKNHTFWGYTSVSQDGVEWWKRLPTRPPVPQSAA